MTHEIRHRTARHGVPLARLAAAAFAVGGLMTAYVATDVASAASTGVVSTSKTAKYGTFLVSGNTVYALKASKVACGTGCLKVWPQLLLPAGMTAATAGNGVDASKLGTVAAPGGRLQVTYGGKPLFYFYKDHHGQVKGVVTDKWGKWNVVVTAKPTGSTSGSGGGTSSGSGGASF